ncbi:hypothetical protein [Kribbella sp. NPDC049227]|uniref:hypothetical protein n=1 Tax=Kribbella sp. NPDC049227 TaxID=3364113 RepID=UPI00371AD8AF
MGKFWCRRGSVVPVDLRIRVLLSFQRALWEQVTPGLRGVAVRVGSQMVEGRFLYDGVPGEVEEEIVSETETYVIADLEPAVGVSFRAEWAPEATARTLGPGEEWVYLRREPTG